MLFGFTGEKSIFGGRGLKVVVVSVTVEDISCSERSQVVEDGESECVNSCAWEVILVSLGRRVESQTRGTRGNPHIGITSKRPSTDEIHDEGSLGKRGYTLRGRKRWVVP